MTISVWLQNLTWEDIKEQIAKSQGTIIFPIGSTEQHGPHLPVGTDTMVANALAETAAKESEEIAIKAKDAVQAAKRAYDQTAKRAEEAGAASREAIELKAIMQKFSKSDKNISTGEDSS